MIVLNGNAMHNQKAMHAHLRERLSLPDYYGGNLDALNDCLAERAGRELIVLQDAGAFLQVCGEYGLKLMQVFNDNGFLVLLD